VWSCLVTEGEDADELNGGDSLCTSLGNSNSARFEPLLEMYVLEVRQLVYSSSTAKAQNVPNMSVFHV
jgi:hypothetical protein